MIWNVIILKMNEVIRCSVTVVVFYLWNVSSWKRKYSRSTTWTESLCLLSSGISSEMKRTWTCGDSVLSSLVLYRVWMPAMVSSAWLCLCRGLSATVAAPELCPGVKLVGKSKIYRLLMGHLPFRTASQMLSILLIMTRSWEQRNIGNELNN